jgi:hypothetical protein
MKLRLLALTFAFFLSTPIFAGEIGTGPVVTPPPPTTTSSTTPDPTDGEIGTGPLAAIIQFTLTVISVF